MFIFGLKITFKAHFKETIYIYFDMNLFSLVASCYLNSVRFSRCLLKCIQLIRDALNMTGSWDWFFTLCLCLLTIFFVSVIIKIPCCCCLTILKFNLDQIKIKKKKEKKKNLINWLLYAQLKIDFQLPIIDMDHQSTIFSFTIFNYTVTKSIDALGNL